MQEAAGLLEVLGCVAAFAAAAAAVTRRIVIPRLSVRGNVPTPPGMCMHASPRVA